jgi:chromosome segregation ATPase
MSPETEINWWMETFQFIAAVAQPLIVLALGGLISVWIAFGRRLAAAADTAERALELAQRTGDAVDGLNQSVNKLNETLHNIDIHNTRMEGRVAEIQEEVHSLREAKHVTNNKLQIHETKIALLEQTRR